MPLKNRSKIRVTVLFGGPSNERVVSLSSGRQVIKNLDRRKYHVQSIIVGRNGLSVGTGSTLRKTDVAFIALHGAYGEDGTIQRRLHQHDIAFTGTSSRWSARAFDKARVNRKLKGHGFSIPPWQMMNKKIDLTFPVVVKPIRGGSSIGVRIITVAKRFPKHIPSNTFLVQKYIEGTEISCGVLERHGKPFAVLPTEIHPRLGSFFDYRAKYSQGGSREITPARLPKQQLYTVQRLALRAHVLLKCRGFSRSDFIFDGRHFWFLETNTIPGLTPTSLLPQGAKAMGISYPQMLDLIIESARRA